MTTPRPLTGRERQRRAAIQRRAAVGLGIVFLFSFAVVVFLITGGTELVGPNGATLDCGSILVPSQSPFAAGNCDGVNDGFLVGAVVASVIGVVALAVGIVLFARSRQHARSCTARTEPNAASGRSRWRSHRRRPRS